MSYEKIVEDIDFIEFDDSGVVCKTYQPVPSTVKLPAKYTQEYIDSISDEYKNVSDEQIFHVALDMLKGTSGDFSRKAILGYNVTQYPVKVMFKDLSEINEAYSTFDAIGWKRRENYIYILTLNTSTHLPEQ